ncbi:MAG: Dam family site-specific DNA-(adenine-N6)-methyltransferase [Candidatus Vecturithrix sp.]|jgi:DNA adenine methylase|nr:Dam family site-specific DNA-(adenine-N6)-methyltransferase [Candidatus Vecturithrix sp.]
MKNLPHPIQYQGSKRNLAPFILQYFPKKVKRLVEPFAGTAAISIAAAARNISRAFWINDLNTPLIELLHLIVEHPEEIAEAYTKIWGEQHYDSIEHYYHIREQFNRTQDPKYFLYLLARCVKGSVRYNSDGLFNQSPDKRRKGTRPETMRRNILGMSRLLQGKCYFSSYDYQDVFQQLDCDDVVYMDPPYQGVCGDRDSRYAAGILFPEFVNALAELNNKHIAFLISYDGRKGEKTYGETLPESLQLTKIELEAGRSTQATLLGRDEITIESLYLSPALLRQNIQPPTAYIKPKGEQFILLETYEQYSTIT